MGGEPPWPPHFNINHWPIMTLTENGRSAVDLVVRDTPALDERPSLGRVRGGRLLYCV